MKSFYRTIFEALSFLCLVLGVGGAALSVYSLTKSMWLSFAILLLVALCLLFVVGRYFVPDANLWRFRARKYPTSGFIGKRQTEVRIDSEFEATIARSLQLIFTETPTEQDLVDIVDLLPEESIDERHYSSSDSKVVRIVSTRKNRIALHWSPVNGLIKPLIPYTHNMKYVSPDKYGEDAFYHSYIVDRPTGQSRTIIHSDVQIERAMAFMLPWHQTQVTLRLVYIYGLLRRLRNSPQPHLSDDGHSVTWDIESPEVGRVYVLLAIYKGEEGVFRQESEALLYRSKFRALFNRLASSVYALVH